MNSLPDNLKSILNANLNPIRNAPRESAGIFLEPKGLFAEDFLANGPTQGQNHHRLSPNSSQAYLQSISPLSNQNLNLNSSQPPNPILNSFLSNLAHPAHTITSSLGLHSASISSFGQTPSAFPVRDLLVQSVSPFSTPISTLPPPSAPMASNITTPTKPPGKRKAAQTRFQELPLFFTDLEIIHAFTVYLTNKTTIFITLKKSQVDAIRLCQKSIFLRFCKFDPSRAFQKENLPKNISLSINNCLVPLVSYRVRCPGSPFCFPA